MAATDLTRSRGCSRGRRVFRTAHTAPRYRGGEPVGLSNMVQFPAGSSTFLNKANNLNQQYMTYRASQVQQARLLPRRSR